MNPELPLPCRWCDPRFVLVAPRVNTSDGTMYWVFCPDCGMHGPAGTSEQVAIARWNFVCRPSPAADEGAAEEICKYLKISHNIFALTEIKAILRRHSAVSPKAGREDDVSYSRPYALQLFRLVTASENLLDTCEVDFFARRDGTADAVVRKDYWNIWVSAVRALKPRSAIKAAQEVSSDE